MMDIGLYVISYGRSDAIKTYYSVPSATYVVRKSEEAAYNDTDVEHVWGVKDDLIDSWSKVMNYILDNAKEKAICIMDDDLDGFFYVCKTAWRIDDRNLIRDELWRIAQMVHDLEIGHGLLAFSPDPKKYHKEFAFNGTGGGTYFFNLDKCKSRFNPEAYAVADAEFQLQELLANRIVLYPSYIVGTTEFNTGTNSQQRTLQKVTDSIIWTKLKWGKYFGVTDAGKTKINIKR